jgi:hypothetical protein
MRPIQLAAGAAVQPPVVAVWLSVLVAVALSVAVSAAVAVAVLSYKEAQIAKRKEEVEAIRAFGLGQELEAGYADAVAAGHVLRCRGCRAVALGGWGAVPRPIGTPPVPCPARYHALVMGVSMIYACGWCNLTHGTYAEAVLR